MKAIKNFAAYFVYTLLLFVVKLTPVKKRGKQLLVIKMDEIGDYILFRNLMPYFKKSDKYKDHHLTIIGNKAWKSIYDTYDANKEDTILWLDKTKFKKDLGYRFKFLKEVRAVAASELINCIYSRTIVLDDGFAFVSGANYKVAMKNDYTNRSKSWDFTDKYIYEEVINAGDESHFDPVRNKAYLEKVLGLENLPISTHLEVKHNYELPHQDYFVAFTGAGNLERQWPIKYYASTAKYISSQYGLMPILCSGPGDEKDGKEFALEYTDSFINKIGKTSLPELIELLAKAKFILCVDTGALHMAAAVGCPVVGLFSGKFYKRFAPYPKENAPNFYAIYPDFVDELIKRNDPILYDVSVMKNNTMKLIPPEKVKPYIDSVMQG